MFSTGCGERQQPVIVAVDTSCEKYRHISATPEQISIIERFWSVMESWARQVAAHNKEYDGDCLKPAPAASRFGGPK